RIFTPEIVIMRPVLFLNFLRRNVAYVSILHHFRALHLFFPVYTLHIASNNRAQKPGTTFA
ncbi:hypothetical protein ACXG8O_005289, partial [Citrobacter youngae]